MADKSNAGARHRLTVDTPPQQIPQDMTGPGNLIPLSPQWLLPKPGDNRPGIFAGDSHLSPHPGNHPDAVKASGKLEDFQNAEKRRDVFRPSVQDAEGGRRDRWRDEERETNFAIRRDRWREGDRDKETNDMHRDRWMDNSFGHSGDARRASSDRWNDTGNRENNFDQRRENKWNTRWGPDDKETDGWREKRTDSGRDDDGSRDKGLPHQSNMEKEGDTSSRLWRSNASQVRWRGDSSLTPSKQSQIFGYGRGRGGNGSSVYSDVRGRGVIGSNNNGSGSHFHLMGTLIDRPATAPEDSSALRYSRTKFLDIYRMMDVKNHRTLLEGFIDVPSLTQMEPSEPLALTTPSPEESVILKDIDKGDIISSGTSQVIKDGFVGQNSVDTVTSRHAKLGSREDLLSAMDDSKDDISEKLKGYPLGYLDYAVYDKHINQCGTDLKVDSIQSLHSRQDGTLNTEVLRSEGANLRKGDKAVARERVLERSSSQGVNPWRSQSMGEFSSGLSDDWKEFSPDMRPRTTDVGWSHLQKNEEVKMSTITIPSTDYSDRLPHEGSEGFQSEISRALKYKRQPSEVLDRERESHMTLCHEGLLVSRDKATFRKFQMQPSPEELLLHYKDPQGQIQGPFSGSELMGWFEAGYFGIDLKVRLADAPSDAPFSLLGDVMPQLRMKATPPPGFGVHKQTEAVEGPITGKLAEQGNIHAGIGELEHVITGQRKRHESATEAENRFLETLMARNMATPVDSFSFSEGAKGYASGGSAGVSTVHGEPGNDLNFLLAQRMLERQQPVPNHLPFWAGKDPASILSKPEFVLDSPAQYSKLIPPTADTAQSSAHVSHHADLLSLLQAARDKAPSPAANTSIPTWINFPDAQHLTDNTRHSGMSAVKDSIDMHHSQHFASQAGYGVQPQHLPQPNQPSLPHMIPQPTDHPSNFVSPEKVQSSVISQDPHVLNLLHQQYMLSQLQLQSQMPIPTQLALLDKVFLMKEQQKQEQQQQLLLQQQHLLSQILSEYQTQRHSGESPYGLLQVAGTAGNAPSNSNHLGLQRPPEVFDIHTQMQTLNLQDGRVPNMQNLGLKDGQASNLPNLPVQGPQDVGYIVSSSTSSLHMTHPLLEHNKNSTGWDTLPEYIQNIARSDLVPTVPVLEKASLSEVMEKPSEEVLVQQEPVLDLDTDAGQKEVEMVGVPAAEEIKSSTPSDESPVKSERSSSVYQQINDVKIVSDYILEQSSIESSVMKNMKHLEDREVKKSSEKKSKKQKNSKLQSTLERSKGSAKSVNCEQSKVDPEIEVTSTSVKKMNIQSEEKESLNGTLSLKGFDAESVVTIEEPPSSQQVHLSSTKCVIGDNFETASYSNTELGEPKCASQSNMQTPLQQAWKPAQSLKAKSLLEIQQEEQQRAQVEVLASDTAASSAPASGFSSAPWSGVVANADRKSSRDVFDRGVNSQSVLGSSGDNQNSRSMKSQLHDLVTEVSVESNADLADTSTTTERNSLVYPTDMDAQTDCATYEDGDFIEAKDTKKSRKKAAKAKGAAVKNPAPIPSADPIPSVPIEKSKGARQAQQEEFSSVLPAGLSLGDFVSWKGDESNFSPAPAWSTDSLRVHKPTLLRDILKEQEKKASSVPRQILKPSPAKPQQNRNTQGTSSLWQIPGSYSSEAASPITNNSGLKAKTEDDLFWGPLDQPKQEAKQSDFPSLATFCSWGTKGAPSKNATGMVSVQPKTSGRTYTLSSSLASQPVVKGRGDAMSSHSEAMGFRDWCVSELVRLTGSKDTGFLEFCLKQSTSEAELLLRENLGSFDPRHEFINKFMNYKELLPADVLEIAFQSRHAGETGAHGNIDADTVNGVDGSENKGGPGKKKGRKGKKVSPSVLGFNVVSNRIMMGEIQNVED